MRNLILAAGVAALAITSPAASQPGDRGGGKDRKAEVQKKRGEASAQRAKGKQNVERRAQRADRPERRAQRAERPAQRAQRAERAERPAQQRAQRAERSQAVERRAQAQDRPAQRVQRVQSQREQRADRAQRVREQRVAGRERVIDNRNRQIDRLAERSDRRVQQLSQQRAVQINRIANRQDRRLAQLAETRIVPLSEWNDLARGGVWLNGCPPGLAKKPVPCVPPGQVRNIVGQKVSLLRDRVNLQPVPNRLRYAYADTDDYYYRYGNGYMYRVDRSNDLVRSLLPLFGLGLTVGQPFPMNYSNSYLPAQYQPFYASSPYANNHYANGYVYQVDPRTGMIVDVDPMLGYGYGYGQMMPATYSAYNVPYQYRPLYQDTANSYYRYAPGAIYQVDPSTSLITAVAALLTGGMTVGQPMPAGYGAYNVPYDYRARYYDTPDNWYRYSNNRIYQVDPATQLVTAIVASALT